MGECDRSNTPCQICQFECLINTVQDPTQDRAASVKELLKACTGEGGTYDQLLYRIGVLARRLSSLNLGKVSLTVRPVTTLRVLSMLAEMDLALAISSAFPLLQAL